MKKIKLGRKEYFIIERDELSKRVVKPMAQAATIQKFLKEYALFLEENMEGANEEQVYLLRCALEMLGGSAGNIKDELDKFVNGPYN